LPRITILGPLILHDTILVIKAAIGHEQNSATHVQMSYTDGAALFSASVKPAENGLGSSVFPDISSFAEFIKNGVSSFGPSLEPGTLSKVDLHKEEVNYRAFDAKVEFSELFNESWADAGMEFDCAVRAKTGTRYIWTYQGLWFEQST
jgi:hypothetical protein